MNKNVKMLAIATLVFGPAAIGSLSGPAAAHNFNEAHSSRGKCESALAATNNEDRKGAQEEGANPGLVNRELHHYFECQKMADGKWYIVLVNV